MRHPQDHVEEQRGEHDLGDDRCDQAVPGGGVVAEAVSREPSRVRRLGEALRAVEGNQREQTGADDAADQLCADVGQDVLPGQATRGSDAEGDGRVEVAARDRPEGIGADEHDEADRQGDSENADVGGGEDRGADEGDDEEERSDGLGDEAGGE